jgi:hypothetical protein
MSLRLSDKGNDARDKTPVRIRAHVRDLSLYGYHNGLFLLAARVEMDSDLERMAQAFDSGDNEGEGDSSWWTPLFTADFTGVHALQVEHWLRFTKAARLLRPAFPEQQMEGKIEQVSLEQSQNPCLAKFDYQDSFSPVVLKWLELLTGHDFSNDPARLLFVRDDRMVVNVAYGLAGPAPGDDPEAAEALRRLFSLALFVDRGKDGFASQDGYAYDRAFVQSQLDQRVNRRWEGVGSLYGYTNYSNVAMGLGEMFNGPIANVHIPFVYGRMLVVALFYELSLAHFARRVSIATENLVEQPRQSLSRQIEDFSKLHQDFIRFTNDHWFREVTSQTQGEEIFRLQTQALRLDEKYTLVKDALERADEYVEVNSARRLNEKAGTIARWALGLTMVALVIYVLQIQPPTDPSLIDFWQIPWNELFNWESWKRVNWRFDIALALVVFTLTMVFLRFCIPGLIRLVIKKCKFHKDKRKLKRG